MNQNFRKTVFFFLTFLYTGGKNVNGAGFQQEDRGSWAEKEGRGGEGELGLGWEMGQWNNGGAGDPTETHPRAGS